MTIFLLIGLGIGLGAGVLAGLVGIGGGIVIVPLLTFIGLTQREASGTSLAALLLPVGVLGFIEYYTRGEVKLPYAIGIAIGLLIGALVGAVLAGHVSNALLQKLFGLLLLAVATKLLLFS